MKNKLLLIVSLIGIAANGIAQTNVARDFYNNISKWCQTNDEAYRKKAQKLLADVCRCGKDVMSDYPQRADHLHQYKDYPAGLYIGGFRSAMSRDNLRLIVLETRELGHDEMEVNYGISKKNAQHEDKIHYVKCHIKAFGSLNYDRQNILTIKDDKIYLIDKYEEVVDSGTGKKKAKIDISDIIDEILDAENYAFGYNYSEPFPLGIYGLYSLGTFYVGAELGFSTLQKKYTHEEMEIEDILHYQHTLRTYTPIGYIDAVGGIRLKYFSIGCGLGVVGFKTRETPSDDGYNFQSQSFSYSYSVSSNPYASWSFMLRPQANVWIPCGMDEFCILGINYSIHPKVKDLNAIGFSIGYAW